MVPNKFNVVNFEGFDLVSEIGSKVPGIYDRIVDSLWNCVYIMCYGLKFGGIVIPPQYMMPEMEDGNVILNNAIIVFADDTISIKLDGVTTPLVADTNGVYTSASLFGFDPVTVQVPISYGKVHFMVGDNEIHSEIIESGEVASYTGVFDGDLYYGESGLIASDTYVQMEKIPSTYSIVQITLSENMFIREGNNLRLRSKSNSGSGIILTKGPGHTLRARWVISSYRQVGNCKETATFPTVVTSGTGRGSYSSPSNNVDFTVTSNTTNPNIFLGYVSGESELLIYNFFE